MSWYPDLPHVQALGDGGPRSTTQMVVIHATDNTASAEAEAGYSTRRTDKISAHFYVDADSTVQALDTTHIAWGCYPTGNSRSVQLELCGLSNHLSDATMRQAAPIVARACAEFGVPIRKVSPADLRAGTRGVCGHADVTAAWGQGDHTDPGTAFPWSTFLMYVQAAAGGQDLEDDMVDPTVMAILRELQGMARMQHWAWAPSAEEWAKAGGDPAVYKTIGASALVPLVKKAALDDVDEQQIVVGVLSGLTAEQIAAAIPPGIAVAVADELGRRIGSQAQAGTTPA